MKTLNKTLMAVSLSLFAIAPAFASHDDRRPMKNDSVLERQEHQQHRIHQGVKKHQLTHKEAKLLRRQQREIRHMERHFYKDGYLSRSERRRLNRELHASSLQIKRLKHNDLGRYEEHPQRYAHHDHTRRP